MMNSNIFDVVTVTLNPAIDRTVSIRSFTAGAVNRVEEEIHCNPGGKGVNVASALADYGCSVAATGFLGRENAAAFEELFDRKQIADHFVRIPGQTRVGIKITDSVRQETTDINFPGPEVEEVQLDSLRRQLERLSSQGCAWFVLAGSVPPGVDAVIYRDLCQMLRERGQNVALDASGEPLRLALEAKPQIVKPNLHELEGLVGKKLEGLPAITEAARNLVSRGVEMVAVSMA